jgi:predicted ArsR family transcriptional regulator
MDNVRKKTAAKPLADRQPMCDNDILRLLADRHGHSVSEMAARFRVTPTVIRNRLRRLMLKQSVSCGRAEMTHKRGRPQSLYYLTSRGAAALADAADQGTA